VTGERPRPKLALVYHPASFSVFQLVEAASDVCSIVWVVDEAVDGGVPNARLLSRFGSVVNVTGMDETQAAAAVADHRPDGIISFKDKRLRFTAGLAERLGLPFHSGSVARRLTDKFAQREALRAGGVPVPEFRVVPPFGDGAGWDGFVAGASFPAVLKPRLDNEASRDTIPIASAEELRIHAARGDGTEFVLEEYLGDRDGVMRPCFADYVSVESVVSHGQVSHIAITGRFPPAEPFRESGFFIEAELNPTDRLAALRAATAAIEALGITTGCCHTEVKFTPQGARVIEVNGRIGGGVPEMLADITDIELLKVAMRVALGAEIHYEQPLVPDRIGFLFYVHAPRWMRQVTAVEGLEQLSEDPRVTEVILNRAPGQLVDWREGNHGHVFSVRGTVADHDELEQVDHLVHAGVSIGGTRGPDEAEQPASSTA
jgi:biotin carboxylase